MFILTKDDLLTDISKDELDGISAELLSQGQTDPVAKEIAESLALIQMYIDPWSVKEDVIRRLWRLLAISGLYNRLAVMPEKRKDERIWCLSILTQIRDGKFLNISINVEAEYVPSFGRWGSRTRQTFSGLTGTDV